MENYNKLFKLLHLKAFVHCYYGRTTLLSPTFKPGWKSFKYIQVLRSVTIFTQYPVKVDVYLHISSDHVSFRVYYERNVRLTYNEA